MEELAGGAGIGGEEEGTLQARTQGRPAGWGHAGWLGFTERRRDGKASTSSLVPDAVLD